MHDEDNSEYIRDENGDRLAYNISNYRLSKVIYRGRYRDGKWKQYESQPVLTMKNIDNETVEIWMDDVYFGKATFLEGKGEYALDLNSITLKRIGDLEEYE